MFNQDKKNDQAAERQAQLVRKRLFEIECDKPVKEQDRWKKKR
ncbi:hypothetical protein [Streptococcus anginosus]|nr:hypothetical protein [Streptococcus anginosus]MCW1013289.1 hypothetical protein [Streptococcus anginosus]